MFGFNFGQSYPSNEKPNTVFDAVLKGDIATLKKLLAEGVAINAKGEDGYTALMAAASLGRGDMVKILLDANADLNAVNDDGLTAMQVASNNNHAEVVKLLSDAGNKSNERMMSS
jgi:ankyrin repeat protein